MLSRSTTIAKVLALGVFDFFALGIVGENVGLLYSRIVPDSLAWGWSLYAIGLLLALGTLVCVAAGIGTVVIAREPAAPDVTVART